MPTLGPKQKLADDKAKDKATPKPKPTCVDIALGTLRAAGLADINPANVRKVDTTLLSATILAQALDRLSRTMIEAAAVSSYKRSS